MLKSHRGDTLIEVLFSITIFALIAVITVNLMNNGVATAQKSLEMTMARNEIDAQAEALRFVHNSYLAERNLLGGSRQFQKLWGTLTGRTAQAPSQVLAASFNNMKHCTEVYEGYDYEHDGDERTVPPLRSYKAFVLNTRLIQPELLGLKKVDGVDYRDLLEYTVVGATDLPDNRLQPTTLYPRLIFTLWGNSGFNPEAHATPALKEGEMLRRIARAEGIWVIAVQGGHINTRLDPHQPEYYDFHIRTCWHSVGHSAPSTIGTIIRLYNPDFIEGDATP
jgi:prepilin-type N-terminal cleavage/methylation domain-containing protein